MPLPVTHRLRLAFPLREERVGQREVRRRLRRHGLDFTRASNCAFLKIKTKPDGTYIVNKLIKNES